MERLRFDKINNEYSVEVSGGVSGSAVLLISDFICRYFAILSGFSFTFVKK